jgi:hypothetical protein
MFTGMHDTGVVVRGLFETLREGVGMIITQCLSSSSKRHDTLTITGKFDIV